VSGQRHPHTNGAARPRQAQPRPAVERAAPNAGHAPPTRDDPAASAATPRLWWPGATHRDQHAVPRATFLRSFVFAWNGLRYAVLTQRNARVHALLAAIAIALGIWLRISPIEFAIVVLAITGVFIAEMFNTVAEACVDLITDQYHALAQVAKDVAAGAVLLSAMLAVVVGLFVFMPHIWPLLGRWLGR
jgi:diacylglycerol kinase